MLKVYALKDIKGELYEAPFYVRTTAEAIRAFRKAYLTENSPVRLYPDDFALYELGTFNEETAGFNLKEAPVLICVASEFGERSDLQK